MYLSERDVREIAAYSRIALSDEDIAVMTVDLNNTMESLKPITECSLEGVEPTYHPIAGLTNVMREDVAQPGLSLEEALMNASVQKDGQFIVPQILGEGGDK